MRFRTLLTQNNNKGELILDGLQFWFDGKNNQGSSFNQSATTWYPYMKNSAIPSDYYLSKQGSGSWNSNGGFIASGSYGYFSKKYYTPFYYLPTVYDFTFVCCVGNLIANKNTICPVGCTYNSGSGTNRWAFYIDGLARNYNFGINTGSWNYYYATINSAADTQIKTIIIVRNGINVRVYINGNYDNTIIASSAYLGKIYGVSFSLGAYDPNSTKLEVPYYSCQMYNRVLSVDEIKNTHKFITDRYELT